MKVCLSTNLITLDMFVILFKAQTDIYRILRTCAMNIRIKCTLTINLPVSLFLECVSQI